MDTKSKQFWIRFSFLALTPIFLGLTSAIIFVNQFKASYILPFEEKVTEMDSIISFKDSIIRETTKQGMLLEILSQLPQQAQLELNNLEVDLKSIHQYSKPREVDSLVQVYQNRISRLKPSVHSYEPANDLAAVLIEDYSDKAHQLGWSVRSLLIGEGDKQKESGVIRALEYQIERLKEEKQQLKTEIKEIGADKSGLESDLVVCRQELAAKKCPLVSPQPCHHDACKINQDKKALEVKKRQLEAFLEKLETLNNLTDWVFDKKIREEIKATRTELQTSLKIVNLQLVKIDKP